MNQRDLLLARSVRPVVEMMERRVLLAVHPLTDVPVLHTRPNAAHTIFLDFNGAAAFTWKDDIPPDRVFTDLVLMKFRLPLEHTRASVPNDLESTSVPATAAYSDDDNRDNFTDAEINDIKDIWARVAEFFSPFDVDVTTVDPNNTTNDKTLRVIVGGDGGWREQGGYTFPRNPYVENGAAAFGSFSDATKDNTVFVFSEALKASGDDSRKAVAETIGHQVGVSVGLQDAALWVLTLPLTNPPTYAFANDHDNGSSPPVPPAPPAPLPPPDAPVDYIGPIMGDPGDAPNAVWWDGDVTTDIITPPAVPLQRVHGYENEFTILQGVLGVAADDHDESFLSATPLSIGSEQGNIQQTGASGVIETDGTFPGTQADVDAFKFSTVAGTVSFTVTSGKNGTGMLDPWLEIRDYFGNVLAREDDVFTSSNTISATLAEGTYELDVFGPISRNGEPGASLFIRPDPDLGVKEVRGIFAVGEYTITGTIPKGIVNDTFSGADLVFGTTEGDRITITRDPDGKIRNNVNGKITLVDPNIHPINRIVVIADAGTTHDVEGGPDRVIIGHDVPRAYVLAGGGFDTVQGGDFNDTVSGGGGNKGNLIFGEGGNDKLTASGQGGFSFGGVGNDTIYGSKGKDELHGDDGNDRIYGGSGTDLIVGGNGKDTLYGGSGNDTIYGQAGNDLIYGDPGHDTLLGNDGNDTFFARDNEIDSIVGGNGTDQAQVDIDLEPTVLPDTADKTDDIEIFLP